MRLLVCCLFSIITFKVYASPCDDIDRALTEDRKKLLAPIIAKQLNINPVEILKSYRYHSWYIIYFSTRITDNAYLFFGSDPTQSKYLTTWGGAATANEEQEIKQWVFNNAKGIPANLAECFAWHVTKENR